MYFYYYYYSVPFRNTKHKTKIGKEIERENVYQIVRNQEQPRATEQGHLEMATPSPVVEADAPVVLFPEERNAAVARESMQTRHLGRGRVYLRCCQCSTALEPCGSCPVL